MGDQPVGCFISSIDLPVQNITDTLAGIKGCNRIKSILNTVTQVIQEFFSSCIQGLSDGRIARIAVAEYAEAQAKIFIDLRFIRQIQIHVEIRLVGIFKFHLYTANPS